MTRWGSSVKSASFELDTVRHCRESSFCSEPLLDCFSQTVALKAGSCSAIVVASTPVASRVSASSAPVT
jgi:hypothetical protein